MHQLELFIGPRTDPRTCPYGAPTRNTPQEISECAEAFAWAKKECIISAYSCVHSHWILLCSFKCWNSLVAGRNL